jgi:flagellar basal-body rod protein FlgB
MSLFDTTQLGLEAAIRGAAARQQALTQNVANANTPGYQRKDVDFASQLGALMKGNDTKALNDFTPTAQVDSTAVMRADGSTVDIDQEGAQQASNGLLYQSLVSVDRARIDIMQSAIGAK